MHWGSWIRQLAVKRAPPNSVILDDGIQDYLFNDIRTFYDRRSFYDKTGIPHRRGYMFYGPPGSGKSSIVNSIAAKFNLDICLVSISGSGLNDNSLLLLLTSAPPSALILLEDIDAMFPDREKELEKFSEFHGMIEAANQPKKPEVTLSGLLNALDGVAAQSGRIVIYTSNYPERLDSALMRPGRVDVKIKFDYASKFQMQKIFLKFYPDEYTLANTFSENLSDQKITMAEIQKYLLESKDVLSASSNASTYFSEMRRIERDMEQKELEWLQKLAQAKENSEIRDFLKEEQKKKKSRKKNESAPILPEGKKG